ncbi:hypothetical protein LMG28614_06901 [Paraburkholderia ultramafica]|uniref:Cytochrome c domain-containing protein n=1 Tax=Paraburkholderia ultramafica TaxID=1544867 RepID=A0A6S7D6U7_9BURK|nr:hypothetical protein [Paraburkholderia ultramafica]CAB3808879.1 hypothetical protein LMG28614_06901 [Paraburkholderia ultramafica]
MRLTQAAQPCESEDLGCSIFSGQHAIPAQLREDDLPLPGSTTRCVNCHTRTDSADTFAPPLTPGNLFAAKSRRGGPASSYDQAAFCKALRDGIDPADVMLRKTMPHYQINDVECAALWHFVTRP